MVSRAMSQPCARLNHNANTHMRTPCSQKRISTTQADATHEVTAAGPAR